jgi:hypothetical protein
MKIRIPRRRDAAAWSALRAEVDAAAIARAELRAAAAVRRRHAIERRIASLRERPASAGRAIELRGLASELARLRRGGDDEE